MDSEHEGKVGTRELGQRGLQAVRIRRAQGRQRQPERARGRLLGVQTGGGLDARDNRRPRLVHSSQRRQRLDITADAEVAEPARL